MGALNGAFFTNVVGTSLAGPPSLNEQNALLSSEKMRLLSFVAH
jgi:hypothetical protein